VKKLFVVCTECRKEVKVEPPIGQFVSVICGNPDCGANVTYDRNEVREREVASAA
jgi:hypothetical protein